MEFDNTTAAEFRELAQRVIAHSMIEECSEETDTVVIDVVTKRLLEILRLLALENVQCVEDFVFLFTRGFMSAGIYDSRCRTVMRLVCRLLKLSWPGYVNQETIASTDYNLLKQAHHDNEDNEFSAVLLDSDDNLRIDIPTSSHTTARALKIALAAVGGGVALCYAGGISTAAVLSAILRLSASPSLSLLWLSSTWGISVMSSVMGVGGAIKASISMSRRIEDVKDIELEAINVKSDCDKDDDYVVIDDDDDDNGYPVRILVSGWFDEECHPDHPVVWRNAVGPGRDYLLIWERAVLSTCVQSIKSLAWDSGFKFAVDEILSHSLIGGVLSAAALPLSVLSRINHLDNPWSMAMNRARQTGKILASYLLSRKTCDGNCRPVSLIGYSFGAKVIYHCLEELDKAGSRGIIESVVLMGAPVSALWWTSPPSILSSAGSLMDEDRGLENGWERCRRVVSHRLVNCYSTRDWTLALLYRSNNYIMKVAGVSPVMPDSRSITTAVNIDHHEPTNSQTSFWQKSEVLSDLVDYSLDHLVEIENYDVTDLISSHFDYQKSINAIMERVGIEC